MSASIQSKDNWAKAAAEPDFPLALPGGVTMLFRRIPAGNFVMGSRGHYSDEEPRHRVVIARDFYLGKFVVTQEEWAAVAHECPELRDKADPSHFKGQRRPVEQVSWDDACAFCAWLQAWEDLPKGNAEVRLPTEAEWEYACRAGTETEYYNGEGEAALAEVAWFEENSGDETHSVDELPETHPWGLQGMHGNVWEWCRDYYRTGAYRMRVDGTVNPEERKCESGEQYPRRVVRGGARGHPADGCRSTCRYWRGPFVRAMGGGFRVCLVRGPAGTVPAERRDPEGEAR
jgi:formylglycine-generating enzyme required for sulfatase activity